MKNKRLEAMIARIPEYINSGGKCPVWIDCYMGRCFYQDVAPALRTRSVNDNNDFIMEEAKIIKEGNYSPSGHNASSIVNANGISPAVMENHGTVTAVVEPISVAMRGRNPDNPSERGKSNGNYKQRLEMNKSGVANTITSVQKDSMVAELLHIPEATAQGYAEAYEGDSVNLAVPNSKTRRGRVGKQMANTLDCGCQQGVVERANDIPFRIRKLTPRECFRLMGVDDKDIDKIQSSGISNSSQYKLAGNSIVVDTLYYLLKQLLITNTNEEQEEIQLKLF